MVVTKELLKELFAEYNTLYFDNKLGKCDFSFFSKNSSNLGWYCAKEDRKGRQNDKIWIGTSVIWTEELLRRILIYEMIHMYVNRVDGRKQLCLQGYRGVRFPRCKEQSVAYVYADQVV